MPTIQIVHWLCPHCGQQLDIDEILFASQEGRCFRCNARLRPEEWERIANKVLGQAVSLFGIGLVLSVGFGWQVAQSLSRGEEPGATRVFIIVASIAVAVSYAIVLRKWWKAKYGRPTQH